MDDKIPSLFFNWCTDSHLNENGCGMIIMNIMAENNRN